MLEGNLAVRCVTKYKPSRHIIRGDRIRNNFEVRLVKAQDWSFDDDSGQKSVDPKLLPPHKERVSFSYILSHVY